MMNSQNFSNHKLNQNEILYFLHIPKTSGTSLKKFLDSKFNEKNIFPVEKWYDLIENNIWDFSNFKFIRGHYGYGIQQILNKILFV